MPLFPNDVVRSEINRSGNFHFHPVSKATLSRLLGPSYYTGECPVPPREPGTTFFKTTISPSTARTWRQQVMFQPSHRECQRYHRVHIFRIPLAEARLMRIHSYYRNVAPDADIGFIYRLLSVPLFGKSRSISNWRVWILLLCRCLRASSRTP